MMDRTKLQRTATGLNVGLRGLMEAAIVCGFAYWGVSAGDGLLWEVLLGVVVPVVGFGIWALVDFRWAGMWAEPLRLIEELLISGLAALAWARSGQVVFGMAVAVLSIVHHILVYATGQRLLKG